MNQASIDCASPLPKDQFSQETSKLALALAELGLIDEYEFMVQPRLAGHGPTLFAGLSKPVYLKLVSWLPLGGGGDAP